MKTTPQEPQTIDKHAIYALAVSALIGDSQSGAADIRWPSEEARSAIGWNPAMNDKLVPSIVFDMAFRFGLLVGANVALNPLGTPKLDATISEFTDELNRELNTTEEEKERAFLRRFETA